MPPVAGAAKKCGFLAIPKSGSTRSSTNAVSMVSTLRLGVRNFQTTDVIKAFALIENCRPVLTTTAILRQLSSEALLRNRSGLIISPGDDLEAMESAAKLSEWIRSTIHVTLQ